MIFFTYLTVFIYVLLGFYSLLVIYNFLVLFIYQSKKIKIPVNKKSHNFIFLIPCHNDYDYLGNLLKDISNQDYDKEKIEVIIVFDNCEKKDYSLSIKTTYLHRVDINKMDKIYALDFGTDYILEWRKNSYVINIDADVKINPDFLSNLNINLGNKNIVYQPDFEICSTNPNVMFKIKFLKCKYHLINSVSRTRLKLFCNLNGPLFCIHIDVLKKINWKLLIKDNAIRNLDINYGFLLAINNIKVETIKNLRCLVNEESKTKQTEITKYRRWNYGKFERAKRHSFPLFRLFLKYPSIYTFSSIIELFLPSSFLLLLFPPFLLLLFVLLCKNIIFPSIVIILYYIPILYYTKKYSKLTYLELIFGAFFFLSIRVKILYSKIKNEPVTWR